MRIKLSIDEALEIAKGIQSKEPVHLFNVHDKQESYPIWLVDGKLLINKEIDLEQVPQDVNLFITVNSIDQELLDIYCLKVLGKWFKETTEREISIVNDIFRNLYNVDITDPIAEEIVVRYGITQGGVNIQICDNEVIKDIIQGYYEDATVVQILIADEQEVFVTLVTPTGYKTARHSLNEVQLLTSRVVDRLERRKEDLELALGKYKELEKSLGMNRELELEANVEKSL